MLPDRKLDYTAPYHLNVYGNTQGYVHDLSGMDITSADAQYLGLDKNTMRYGASQVGDAVAMALKSAIAANPVQPYSRWHLPDPDAQFGLLPQAVQRAAAALRTTAFQALHDTCATTQCHYTHVGALQANTTHLQESLEALAAAYGGQVPPVIEARRQQVRQVTARISEAHDQAALVASSAETVTEDAHMAPFVAALPLVGELTRNALPPQQEAAFLRMARVGSHVHAKIAALQDVPDMSVACRTNPLACIRNIVTSISACEKKRHEQLRGNCPNRAGCNVVLCDLSGDFQVQQPNMECVDPVTGTPTGYTWGSHPCPGHQQQLSR